MRPLSEPLDDAFDFEDVREQARFSGDSFDEDKHPRDEKGRFADAAAAIDAAPHFVDPAGDHSAKSGQAMENPIAHAPKGAINDARIALVEAGVEGKTELSPDIWTGPEAKLTDVPLASLLSDQRLVDKEVMREKIKAKGEPISVVRHHGQLLIRDGNHRAVAAWLHGDKTVRAHVVDIDAISARRGKGVYHAQPDFEWRHPRQVFYSEDQPRDEKGRFTLVGDASKLGGATPKQFYRENATGAMHLFKPDPPVKILGAAAASQIARLVDPNAIHAEHVVINGKSGLMQQMVPGSKPMGAPASAADFHAIQREQVIDWITSQHDSHPGQFIRDAQGNVRAVDKSQAWKYFGKDKLSQTYHPNAVYGERPPIYNTALKGSKLDPEVIRPILERASAITKAQSDAILRPYAIHVFGDGTPKYRDFLKAAHERIAGAKAAFSKYYSHLTGKSVKFSAEPEWIVEGFTDDFRALYYAHEQFDFDPDKHPRDEQGRFTDGNGGEEDKGINSPVEVNSPSAGDEDLGSMIKTGEGDVGKSLSEQAKALLAKKEHQKELWKQQGARYRAKKKADAEAKQQAALGIKPPPQPTGEKQPMTPGQAKEALGTLTTGLGKTYGDQEIKGRIDKAIAAIDSKPEYAKNWTDLIEKHGIGAVGIGLMTSSNYEAFSALKDRIERGTNHDTAPMRDGPTKGKIIEQQELLKTAVGMQSGMTPREYLDGTRALRYYTESGYGEINRSLREGHGLDKDGEKLDRFFAKLPDVEKERMMYRAFEAPPNSAFATALRAGKGEFTDPAFLSATTSHSFALEWRSNQPKGDKWDKNSFVLSWKNEGGLKNITPWGSLGTKEGEVMMRPGARIEILSSKWVPQGGYGTSYGKWHCEVRVLPPDPTKDLPSASFKNASAKAQHAAPIGGGYVPPKLGPAGGGGEKKYYYEKKISPNTGKPYYVKKVKK